MEQKTFSGLVASEDDHQVFPLVFHHLQQNLDGFLTVVTLVVLAVEVVGLVDEQHAAHRPLEDILGFGCGVPDVLADQIIAGDRDQMAPAQVAQPVQQFEGALRARLVGRGIVLPTAGRPPKKRSRVDALITAT